MSAQCITITPVSELSIVKTATPASVEAGGTVGYVLVVRNLGRTAYNRISIVDDLSGALDDAVFVGAVAISGSAEFTSPTLTWTGDVPPDATVTITYTMAVAEAPAGDHILTNSVTSPADGSSCTPTAPCQTSTPVTELLITKVASAATVPVGGVVDYTVTLTNHGQTDLFAATFTDDLTGVVDDATVGRPTATVGTALLTPPNVIWTGDLPIGAVAIVTYPVTVASPDPGDHRLVNSVSSTTPGSTCRPASPCATTTLVSGPTITKTVDRTTAFPGDTVTYSIDVANTGQAAIIGAGLRDDLSGVLDDAVFGAASATAGAPPTFAGGEVTWQGDLAVGASVTVTYTVVVNRPGTGDHRLRNAASSPTPGSNCTVDEPCTTDTPIHEIRVVKAVGEVAGPIGITPRVAPGQDIQFTIIVTNVGEVDEPVASVTDDLSGVLDDATLQSFGASAGTVTVTPPNLVWTGSLAIHEEVSITYIARVNSPDSGDHRLTNLVVSTVPVSNCPDALVCGTDTPVDDLTIVKAADRASAAGGDTVTYTVTVTNLGPAPVLGARFVDDLTGVLDDAAFGTVASGNATFTEPSVIWTGDLLAGGAATVTYTVVVDRPSTGDHRLTNSVVSATEGAGCTVLAPCVTTTPVAEWTIAKTAVASSSPAEPGGTVAYTVTLTNTGQDEILDATFTDDLTAVLDDASVDPASVTATAGTVTFTPPTLTWTGNLPVAGPPVVVSYVAPVDDPVTGDHLLTNSIVSPSTDGGVLLLAVGTSGVCVVCTTTTPIAELAITKTIDRSPAAAGDLVTYTMLVTNTGQAPYLPGTVTDDLTGVVDDAAFVAATATTGTTAYSAPTLTWTGDLPVAASVTVTYQLRVNIPGTGDHRLLNAASSADPGSGCPGAATCATDTPVAELAVLKQVDRTTVAAGETITYTVDVTNAGQVGLPDASFTDNLADVLDDADLGPVSATLGDVTVSSPILLWSGDLAVGTSARVTYSVTLTNPGAGDGLLVNAVTSVTPGSNCPIPTPAVAGAGCVVTVQQVLGPTPSPTTSPTMPGQGPTTPGQGPAGPGPAAGAPGPVPVTGLPLGTWVGYAVLLLTLGSLLMWWSRRRRTAADPGS